MPWTYQIKTGRLFSPDGNLIAIGYAGGNCGKNPEGRNNPDMCAFRNIGPLPVGFYVFGNPVEHSKLGPFAIPLDPDLDTVMHDRGDFFIHGDTTPSGNASEGGIIMPRKAREACHASEDQELIVVPE